MDFEDGLEAFLESNPTVADLVKSGTGNDTYYRIFPAGVAGQDPDTPYITYQRISTVDVMSMNGFNNLTRIRMQIDVWADTNREVKTIARALRQLLRGYRGMMGEWEVEACLPEDMEYLPEPAVSGAETGIERIRQDWMITFKDQ